MHSFLLLYFFLIKNGDTQTEVQDSPRPKQKSRTHLDPNKSFESRTRLDKDSPRPKQKF